MAEVIIAIILYLIGLLSFRELLRSDLVLLTHKRLFRHKCKRKIPFMQKFLFLNYVKYFKGKWMFHYVFFIIYIMVGFLPIIAGVVQAIWNENECLEIVFAITLCISIIICGIPMIFSTRYNRQGHSVRRK